MKGAALRRVSKSGQAKGQGSKTVTSMGQHRPEEEQVSYWATKSQRRKPPLAPEGDLAGQRVEQPLLEDPQGEELLQEGPQGRRQRQAKEEEPKHKQGQVRALAEEQETQAPRSFQV